MKKSVLIRRTSASLMEFVARLLEVVVWFALVNRLNLLRIYIVLKFMRLLLM